MIKKITQMIFWGTRNAVVDFVMLGQKLCRRPEATAFKVISK